MKKLIEIFVPRIEGSILLDPFAGSGTTLVAAKELNINYIGIEVVPNYVEIIKRRLDTLNGLQGKLPLSL
jgi:site-specific DNA-methyltransferase (adenine-specific)